MDIGSFEIAQNAAVDFHPAPESANGREMQNEMETGFITVYINISYSGLGVCRTE